MKCDYVIRFWKSFVETVSQYRSRAIDHFFSRLTKQDERAPPLILQSDEYLRCAQHVRYVNVMATGMHYADVLTGIVPGFHFAGVRQASLLVNRKRV